MTEEADGGPVRLRDDQVVWRRMGDEGVVLDLRSSTYLSLNKTGAFLFAQLEHGATERQLADELALAYDLDEPSAAADVRAFLTALSERGLTSVSDAA